MVTAEVYNMTRDYRLITDKGSALYWYDRSLRLWTITLRDQHDNQIGNALYAPTRKLAVKNAELIIVDGTE